MATYKNNNAASSITAVEFTPVSDGNFTFFYTNARANKEEIRQWLTSKDVDQNIVAETVVNGQAVFVTHGHKDKEEMLKLMGDHGEKLELEVPERKINLWKWRGILSMTGHPMQFISSCLGPKGFDWGVGVFAGLNFAANIINITFGAQRSPDKHRLNHLKNEINDDLEDHVTLEGLLKPEENRSALRKDPEPPKSMGTKFHDFMARNSVSLGEVGLRYLGGISLVAPITQWKAGFKELSSGSLGKAWDAIKNKNNFIRYAGSFWLAGKTIAFFAKAEDPYDPKPKTTVDWFREKVAFKLSTLTECIGAGTLAGEKFYRGKIKFRGQQYRDYLGGVGGLLFMAAFAMRFNAPYGVKELNTEEVYAHATDTLAKTPPEKMPQLLAETAATLAEDTKLNPTGVKNVTFGEVFTKMMTDMYRYHGVTAATKNDDVPCACAMPQQVTEQTAATEPFAAPVLASAPSAENNFVMAHPPRKPSERVTIPSGNYAEAAKAAENPEIPMGMGV